MRSRIMENKKWIAFFIALSALLGFGASEVIDDKVHIPILEKTVVEFTQNDCPSAIVIAYTDTGKYYCECLGPECPCTKTEEILSELG